MPLLRLYSESLSLPQKQAIATELTDVVMRIMKLSAGQRHWCVLHFIAMEADCVSVAGTIAADGQFAEYHLDVYAAGLSEDQQRRLFAELTGVLAQHLRCPDNPHRIAIMFHPYDPRNYGSGGRANAR